ncbi:MAG: DUF502 domain-containing protein [Firmicutes bacterium]|nr:DUF502 domain-containing protein [Bacillota bacterium]MCL5039407.1 DUF502 domain-containing protein [Bacillota bacterium]
MAKRFRNYLLAGLIVLFPIYATYYVIIVLFNFIDGMLRPLIDRYLPYHIPGLGALLTIGIVFLTGLLATNFIGRQIIRYGENLLLRMPFVRNVYLLFKQIVDAFWGPGKVTFRQVVLMEFPRQGMYSIGFVTGEGVREAEERVEKSMVSVFIVTTPNPTTGFLFLVPREELVYLDMSVEEGLKLVISGGIISPSYEQVAEQVSKNGSASPDQVLDESQP